MSTHLVIAVYRPKEGGEESLRELLAGHVPALRKLGLATDRPVVLMKTLDGSAYLEVFEWATDDAAHRAHEMPEVGAIWGPMMEVADFPSLGELEESKGRFPHFQPVDDLVV